VVNPPISPDEAVTAPPAETLKFDDDINEAGSAALVDDEIL